MVSLVGRGQIVKEDHNLRSPVDYVKKDRDAQWEALEREDKERKAKQAKDRDEDEAKEDKRGRKEQK